MIQSLEMFNNLTILTGPVSPTETAGSFTNKRVQLMKSCETENQGDWSTRHKNLYSMCMESNGKSKQNVLQQFTN